ncbi:hypothetical protein BT96DRAFT_934156 [Gymnopus androsaceus JB14]|uniref:Uncharacterized protein n=1 Tax=Gymnopus androsaceus JB14 TaxID=1447944 RepID=A0A6A4I988_9AGAR|nr:hypothetical protein BT96DRAFT_934156 [Gymnopus androsaceus JB14]
MTEESDSDTVLHSNEYVYFTNANEVHVTRGTFMIFVLGGHRQSVPLSVNASTTESETIGGSEDDLDKLTQPQNIGQRRVGAGSKMKNAIHNIGLNDNIVITHEELANSLPSKLDPKATGKWKASSKGKEKAPAHKKAHKQISAPGASSSSLHTSTSGSSTTNLEKSIKTDTKCTNHIRIFYKEVACPDPSPQTEGSKYYRCWLEEWATKTVTKWMRGNLNGLIEYLQQKFPAHYQMYKVIQNQATGPTNDEINIAKGLKQLDATTAASYVESLNEVNKNIKNMFEQQGKEAWDQAKFENKLACWMAACDQLFTAVTGPEFQELLQYVHQPGKENLHIPDDKALNSSKDHEDG